MTNFFFKSLRSANWSTKRAQKDWVGMDFYFCTKICLFIDRTGAVITARERLVLLQNIMITVPCHGGIDIIVCVLNPSSSDRLWPVGMNQSLTFVTVLDINLWDIFLKFMKGPFWHDTECDYFSCFLLKIFYFLSITFTFFNHFRFVLNSYWLISAVLWIFEKIANSKMSNGECDIIRTCCELKGDSFCRLKYPPSFIVIALLFSFRKVRMGIHDAYSTISALKFGKLTANKNRTTYLIYGFL